MKIIYTNDTGGVSVVHPTGEVSIEEVIAKDVPEGVAYQVVDDDAIPEQRDFRAAWKLAGESIVEDLAVCRELTKDRLRAERAPLLADLDVEVVRTLESGGDTAFIVTEKQRLRDITNLPEITNAETPDDLRSITL